MVASRPLLGKAAGFRRSLSIVVPCYNEEEVLKSTIDRLKALGDQLSDLHFEIIFVDDGSQDATWSILKAAATEDSRIKLIQLARNFGYQVSTAAGIDAARGDAVVLMDADLQDPPEVVPEMVRKWREGYDVVYGTRSKRMGESRLRLWATRRFYRLISRMSDVDIPLDTGDFRLMNRRVVDTLRAMPERDRFIRGMVSWVGFRQTAVFFERAERHAGAPKLSLRRLIHLAIDGIVSFSFAPLRLSVVLGAVFVFVSLCLAVYFAIAGLLVGMEVAGWAVVVAVVLLVGGAQLVGLGIIGEYLGRTYREIKGRPLYVTQEYFGFEQDGPALSRSPVADGK